MSKHLDTATRVFQNPGASYLVGGGGSDVPSPLNIGIENSRRFRALPVYANIIHYGLEGYQNILLRQVKLARSIASFIQKHEKYELLPPFTIDGDASRDNSNELVIDTKKQIDNVFVVVCFRAKDSDFNEKLVQHIKSTNKMYVSGTTFWDGQPAVRIAVSAALSCWTCRLTDRAV